MKRLVSVDGKLEAQDYATIAFVAVLDQGNSDLSAHSGWYEELAGSGPQVYLLPGHNNFKNPRVDQLVSTATAKTAKEKRNETSSRIAEESSENKKAITNQVAQQVEEAKREAKEESERLLADAQDQINNAQKQANSTMSAGGIGLDVIARSHYRWIRG